jgi:indole-3-glycerol phosphate synthase
MAPRRQYDSVMAPTYLDEILAHHRARAARDTREWRERLETVHYEGPSLFDALSSTAEPFVKVIAEVKRRSPSKGWLARDIDAAALATTYQLAGASAISVLTDEEYFAGSSDDLRAVVAAVTVPVLRKDFTISANDVVDAAEMGASTVLLIVAALNDAELLSLLEVAQFCGVDALVEVHDRDEARRAVQFGARIIGVNQRNLRTFEVDADHAAAVIESLPHDIVSVAESGLKDTADVERAAAAGFDAVLVGETFVTASDVEASVRSFAQVARVNRG